MTHNQPRPVLRRRLALLAMSGALLPSVLLAGCATGAVVAPSNASASASAAGTVQQLDIGSRHKLVIQSAGLSFRDLDGDGQLSAFEDWRLPARDRARDIVARMTLPEKLGTLLHGSLPGPGGRFNPDDDGYGLDLVGTAINQRHVTSFISRLSTGPERMAEQNNAVQELAEQSRLGIPVTISSDPRNHFQYVLGASEVGGGFSQWPESLGLAALGDAEVVHRFGDIARQEYRAVGLHMTLSPQVDLATEPRWARQLGTFGSDAALNSRMGAAYVSGFQGGADGVQRDGVLAVVKHFAGYGAQPDGFDAHNYYGRYADLTGAELEHHITAFDGALAAHVGGVMPAYPILRGAELDGQMLEPVGAGFSSVLLDRVLRKRLGYQGIVLSDWAITQDCDEPCRAPTAENPQTPAHIATSWGVDHMSKTERFALGLKAGIDQFGGVDDPAPIAEAVQRGLIAPERIDQAVMRIMESKFQLGLFDNPYVDPAAVAEALGNPAFAAQALSVQRRAQLLLQNEGGLLPMAAQRKRVFLFGVDADAARRAGLTVVDTPAEADFAIVRSEAPGETLHPHHFFGSRYKEGRLDFRAGDPAYDALVAASSKVPTVFAIFLDRPAILTNIRDKAGVILANFGASDDAVIDVVLGHAKAEGRLPFELPSSMAAVEAQRSATPDDSADPLYPRGAGIVGK